MFENSERGIWKIFLDLLCVSFVKSIAFLVFSVIIKYCLKMKLERWHVTVYGRRYDNDRTVMVTVHW